MFYVQVFDAMMPFTKWKETKANLGVGDIVLMGYEPKLGKGQYRLARVSSVETDRKGQVRTVEIECRPKSSREVGLPYKSKGLEKKRVSVQNLVLISPKEEILESSS